MHTAENINHSTENAQALTGRLFDNLAPATMAELRGMMRTVSYPAGTVLFSEKDMPELVYVVLEGEVKLSINSSEGKRLILRIAKKGEIIGIASALSGNPYDTTAETLYSSKVAPIGRREFLAFLLRHQDAYQTLTEELSRQFTLACDQLRSVVLSTSAPEKLARLLLDWSENGQRTDQGTRFRFSLTHGEIGEFIGASRETVTRTLSIFRSRRLISFHGSTLTIPNRTALERYARP
jgi:CRP/FNR family cyclic AMP-dependent transcriptional regulator